jgi:MSHA biogenesis protein MshP
MTSRASLLLRRRARQDGLSLVTAIFLVVVLSGLAGAIVNIFISQQTSSAQDLLGVRAYQAARAGIEWGLYRQLRQDSCAGATTVAMPAGTTLSTFTVIVSCTRTADAGPVGITQLLVPATVVVNSLTLTVGNTAGLVEGMRIQGPGIGPGTLIANIDSGTTLTMTNLPLLAGEGVVVNFYSPLDQWTLVSTACNLPTGGACVNPGNQSDYVQRVMQVQF